MTVPRKPSEIITDLVRDRVKPFLVEQGFRASGSTFRRQAGETVQVVQVQRDTRSGPTIGRIYLNGAVYAPALDELLGMPAIDDPDEPSCHVRLRPNAVDANAPEFHDVTPDADLQSLGDAVVGELAALLGVVDTLTTPATVVDFLSGHRLAQYERVFGWYLRQGQQEQARAFVSELHAEFGAQRRWEIFAGRLDDIAARVSGAPDWRSWI